MCRFVRDSWSLVLFLHISHLSFHTFSRIKSMWKKGKYEKVPSINPFFTNLQTKDHKLRSSFLFFWVICNLLSSVGLERIYLLALPPCLLKISLWDDMEVPEESFHWSSWDSRTCYPRRAFIQELTDDLSYRRWNITNWTTRDHRQGSFSGSLGKFVNHCLTNPYLFPLLLLMVINVEDKRIEEIINQLMIAAVVFAGAEINWEEVVWARAQSSVALSLPASLVWFPSKRRR